MNKKKGLFISFEGPEASGKSSQILLLQKYLTKKKISFITTREGFSEKNFHVPLTIPQKHDIELRVKGSATSKVSGGFELVLVGK